MIISSTRGGASREGTERVGRRRAFSQRDLRASNERVRGVCIYYGCIAARGKFRRFSTRRVDILDGISVISLAGVEINFREQFIFG